MEKITNERLRDKENIIKKRISDGEGFYPQSFIHLYKYYLSRNLFNQSPVFSVFIAVYVDKVNMPAWKLAIKLNISRTTLFNYRNEIVKNFETYLSNPLDSELAITKGKNPWTQKKP